jgi:hypothetical protein
LKPERFTIDQVIAVAEKPDRKAEFIKAGHPGKSTPQLSRVRTGLP